MDVSGLLYTPNVLLQGKSPRALLDKKLSGLHWGKEINF
jgi:hypothetical protein